jgi:hypothetical protein
MIPTHIQEKLNERREKLASQIYEQSAGFPSDKEWARLCSINGFEKGAAALMEILLAEKIEFDALLARKKGDRIEEENLNPGWTPVDGFYVGAKWQFNELKSLLAARDSEIERLKKLVDDHQRTTK